MISRAVQFNMCGCFSSRERIVIIIVKYRKRTTRFMKNASKRIYTYLLVNSRLQWVTRVVIFTLDLALFRNSFLKILSEGRQFFYKTKHISVSIVQVHIKKITKYCLKSNILVCKKCFNTSKENIASKIIFDQLNFILRAK